MAEAQLVLGLFALALLGTGVIAGLLAGLLGVGGGIVIVPVLFHIFTLFGIDESVRMHLAVGTSLGTIIPTSIASARAHHARGAVDFDLLRSWAPAILAGVVLGTMTAGIAKGAVLTGVFASVALLVAAHMALAREDLRLADHLPRGAARQMIGAVIGGFSAIMGIGGGTLSVPTLTAFNYPIRRAVGTASAIGLIISLPGTAGFLLSGWGETALPRFSLGYINLLAVALIVPATIWASPRGAAIAHRISTTGLRRAFALFLALTSLRMFWSLA